MSLEKRRASVGVRGGRCRAPGGGVGGVHWQRGDDKATESRRVTTRQQDQSHPSTLYARTKQNPSAKAGELASPRHPKLHAPPATRALRAHCALGHSRALQAPRPLPNRKLALPLPLPIPLAVQIQTRQRPVQIMHRVKLRRDPAPAPNTARRPRVRAQNRLRLRMARIAVDLERRRALRKASAVAVAKFDSMAVCSSLLYRIPWSCYDAKFGNAH
ncbi:hypothetical protein B0H14DRAFT_3762980 [Mycena olivaceomarginata]|nr:hypothetical protein B0H14DRAFT_3762980 [Mycena olivaceomarginata]